MGKAQDGEQGPVGLVPQKPDEDGELGCKLDGGGDDTEGGGDGVECGAGVGVAGKGVLELALDGWVVKGGHVEAGHGMEDVDRVV